MTFEISKNDLLEKWFKIQNFCEIPKDGQNVKELRVEYAHAKFHKYVCFGILIAVYREKEYNIDF